MPNYLFVCSFLFLMQGPLAAQDLTGTWEGGTKDVRVTIVLVKCGDYYVGYNFDRDVYGFCQTHLHAFFDIAKSKLKCKSMGFIDRAGIHSQSNYNFRYSVNDNVEQLEGIATAKSFGSKILAFGLPHTGITLIKKSNKVGLTEYMKEALRKLESQQQILAATPSVNLAPSLDAAKPQAATRTDTLNILEAGQKRANPVVLSITIATDTVRMKIYDNGIEDGDSISIIYNQQVIKSQMRVTIQPVYLMLVLDHSLAEHEITVVAENLGSIPPNTATVEIQAADKTYISRISASLNSNAVIRLKVEATPVK